MRFRDRRVAAQWLIYSLSFKKKNSIIRQRGEIEFEVVYVAPEVDSDDENVEYEDESGHRYRLYLDELEEGMGSSHGNGPADSASLQGKNKKDYIIIINH